MELERLSLGNIAYAVGLAKELHGLGSFGADGPPFDWDYCMFTMRIVMNDPNQFFMLARDEDRGYVGAVAGKALPHYFSPEIMGIEDAWYVRAGTPSRAAVGIMLMRSFVEWCMNEKHALSVQCGDIAGIRSVGVEAIYRRLGFERLGVIYKLARK